MAFDFTDGCFLVPIDVTWRPNRRAGVTLVSSIEPANFTSDAACRYTETPSGYRDAVSNRWAGIHP
jgi:hypothetical protein